MHKYIYVCIYVCVCVCIYVCMYVCVRYLKSFTFNPHLCVIMFRWTNKLRQRCSSFNNPHIV